MADEVRDKKEQTSSPSPTLSDNDGAKPTPEYYYKKQSEPDLRSLVQRRADDYPFSFWARKRISQMVQSGIPLAEAKVREWERLPWDLSKLKGGLGNLKLIKRND